MIVGGGFSCYGSGVLHLVHDCFESFGIVHGEVGENLAVDFDSGLVDESHKLAVGKILKTRSSVDTLNPESAEIAFFLLAVAVGVGKTFFPGVFSYGPYITAAAKVASCKFEDFFTACARCNVVD